jgi:hypothetical protein
MNDELIHRLVRPACWKCAMSVVEDHDAQEIEAYVSALENRIAVVELWQRDGEQKMSGHPVGVLFRLGEWWADRPWRLRP